MTGLPTGVDGLCVLVLDEDAIRDAGTRLIEEDGGDGELFPHIHGPILPRFVLQVVPVAVDQHGHVTF